MSNERLHRIYEQAKENIHRTGLNVTAVFPDETGFFFAYSTGLWMNYNHPEIICVGLPPQVAHPLINDIAIMIKGGKTFKPGKLYDRIMFEKHGAYFVRVPIPNPKVTLGLCNMFYDKPYEVIQLLWPDRDGRFPFEKDARPEFIQAQPLLD